MSLTVLVLVNDKNPCIPAHYPSFPGNGSKMKQTAQRACKQGFESRKSPANSYELQKSCASQTLSMSSCWISMSSRTKSKDTNSETLFWFHTLNSIISDTKMHCICGLFCHYSNTSLKAFIYNAFQKYWWSMIITSVIIHNNTHLFIVTPSEGKLH